MIEVLVDGYLAGWVLTTLGLAFSADRTQDPHSPQRHPLPLALAAGAVWPLLILGVAEYAIVATAAAVFTMRTEHCGASCSSLDEFRSRRSVAYAFHAWTMVPSMSEELNSMSFSDKAKNKVEDLGGQAKEAAGKATDDKSTENEGKVDQAKANLKDAGEKVKDAFK